MVRADRFIGSRIAESKNKKFLWWAEGTKFSNVQCDWWARALGNMDLLPGVCHCTGKQPGLEPPAEAYHTMQSALPEQSGGGGLWSGQCTGKLCRVRAIISRSFPFRKWIPLPLDSPPKVELSQVRGIDSPLWASSSSRLGR